MKARPAFGDNLVCPNFDQTIGPIILFDDGIHASSLNRLNVIKQRWFILLILLISVRSSIRIIISS